MDVAELAQYRKQHGRVRHPQSSTKFALRVLQQVKADLHFQRTIERTRFLRNPSTSAAGAGGEEDWDWPAFFAALPSQNYDLFTGGSGILEFGIRRVDVAEDPDYYVPHLGLLRRPCSTACSPSVVQFLRW